MPANGKWDLIRRLKVKHPVALFLIINPAARRQHNFMKVNINFSYYYMTACFDHITVIFRPTINIKMYIIFVCIYFYINGSSENEAMRPKHVALEYEQLMSTIIRLC